MAKRRYATVAPEVQRAIVREYRPGVRGRGLRALARKYDLSVGTVQHVVERGGPGRRDPVIPRGHRERKLGGKQEAKLLRAADRNPMATNRQLAAAVAGAIAPRTVSTYLSQADPPFTRKVAQDQDPKERTAEWKAEVRAWLGRVSRIAMRRRVYADETAVYGNEAPKRGRSRRGKPVIRPRSRYARRYTLHVYARQTGVVHWELSEQTANTPEVERVAAAAAEKMKDGDILIWDRLGRSGRAANPKACHYSPVARAAFAEHGVGVEHLPPLGKYLNPVELFFQDLKSHCLRPAFPGDGKNLKFSQLQSLIAEYVSSRAPATLPGFFASSANGGQAQAQGLF